MTLKSFGILIVLLSSCHALLAQTGSTGFEPLKIGVGGRALAMGEAYSALASDPAGTFYNPAALSLTHTPQILLMNKEWLTDTRTEFLGATTTWNKFSLGLGAN